MFNKIGMIFKVLKEGESLIHPETWKNAQLVTNALVTVITVVVIFVPNLGLSTDDILNIATGVALIGSVINGYLTTATTKKIGFGTTTPEPELMPEPTTEATSNAVPTKNSLNGGSNLLSGK